MKTKVNKKFIEKELIPFVLREHGRGFAMSCWINKQDAGTFAYNDGIAREVPDCGAVACLGGSVNLLAGKRALRNDDHAAKVLGLSSEQAKSLFYYWQMKDEEERHHWPLKFISAYAKRRTPFGKAKVAVALLREVIRTNGKCLGPHLR
jgi:hypothetical protein